MNGTVVHISCSPCSLAPPPPAIPTRGARARRPRKARCSFTCHRSDPRDGCEVLGGRVPLDLLEREQSLHLSAPARHQGGRDLPARRAHAQSTRARPALSPALSPALRGAARRDGVRRACGHVPKPKPKPTSLAHLGAARREYDALLAEGLLVARADELDLRARDRVDPRPDHLPHDLRGGRGRVEARRPCTHGALPAG